MKKSLNEVKKLEDLPNIGKSITAVFSNMRYSLAWGMGHGAWGMGLPRVSHKPAICCSEDLRSIGIEQPDQLKRRSPLEVFHELANVMGHRHDPCVFDALISVKKFLNGEPAKPWWSYTDERRNLLANHVKGESK